MPGTNVPTTLTTKLQSLHAPQHSGIAQNSRHSKAASSWAQRLGYRGNPVWWLTRLRVLMEGWAHRGLVCFPWSSAPWPGSVRLFILCLAQSSTVGSAYWTRGPVTLLSIYSEEWRSPPPVPPTMLPPQGLPKRSPLLLQPVWICWLISKSITLGKFHCCMVYRFWEAELIRW